MNPLTVIPPKIRLYIYAVLSLAAVVWGIYDATGGDWREFIPKLLAALVSLMAASNVPTEPAKPVHDPNRDNLED